MPSSLNDVKLIPYAKVDGEWTLPDGLILDAAWRAEREGSFKRVFYEGHIKTPGEFLEAMKKPANVPVFAFQGMRCIGWAWLNGFSGSYAFAHFCFLKCGWGELALEASQKFLDYWMTFKSAEGQPLLNTILGTIPSANDRAVRFVERLGFSRVGVVPGMLSFLGDRADCVILYYSRFEHGKEG